MIEGLFLFGFVSMICTIFIVNLIRLAKKIVREDERTLRPTIWVTVSFIFIVYMIMISNGAIH
ncbi:hypothetical protein [Bacillus sp. Marseille-Q3570]|uniref:hypothetical protein n=1 Tax=Bacillus sp. Marseille-Q3570 TaxID=2963522 RepID=UPI0021B83D58|nr:hypothetical protein [Bacillus sp. Marseille-Q3570]